MEKILENMKDFRKVIKYVTKDEKNSIKKEIRKELKMELLNLRLIYKKKLEMKVGFKRANRMCNDEIKYKALEHTFSNADMLKYIYMEIMDEYNNYSYEGADKKTPQHTCRNWQFVKLTENEYRYRINAMSSLLTSKSFLSKQIVIKPIHLYSKLLKREIGERGVSFM